jgi:pimeloyl-ACP methyl ester carboxylesterase
MERPRLLLVPQLTELEWLIKPQLEQWAEVLAYDAPGVGDAPEAESSDSEAVARRGLEELDRRGWDRCVVVADEFGVTAAAHIVAIAPDRVQAMAIGHARLSTALEGERASLNREVYAGLMALMRADTRTFVRQLFRLTGGETMEGGYGEDMVNAYLERVPVERMLPFWESRPEEGDHIGDHLRSLDVPLLLAQHKGCLLYTDEGFEDAVKALPNAHTVSTDEKPSTSQEFARVLEAFCREQVLDSAQPRS